MINHFFGRWILGLGLAHTEPRLNISSILMALDQNMNFWHFCAFFRVEIQMFQFLTFL